MDNEFTGGFIVSVVTMLLVWLLCIHNPREEGQKELHSCVMGQAVGCMSAVQSCSEYQGDRAKLYRWTYKNATGKELPNLDKE